MTLCLAYLRVSRKEQATNDHFSFDFQLNAIRRFVDRQDDWKLKYIIKDPGFSGSTIDRPGLEKVINYAYEGRIKKILVWRFDRLARHQLHFPMLLHIFNQECKVDIVSATEPVSNDGDPLNELMIGLLGLWANMESKITKMRSIAGKEMKFKNSINNGGGYYLGGEAPFGYYWDTEIHKNGQQKRTRLKINEEQAPIVKMIFDLYEKYHSQNQVRNHLEQNNIPFPTGCWILSNVRAILRRRRYLGELKFRGITNQDENIRIIDDEQWGRVHTIMEARRKMFPQFHGQWDRIMNKHKLTFGKVYEDERINRYLDVKVDMKPCPKCNSKMFVKRNGYYYSKKLKRKRQCYYCWSCDAKFSDRVMDKIEHPPCPVCDKNDRVWRKQKAQNTKGEYVRYHCQRCNRHFTRYQWTYDIYRKCKKK